MSTSSANLSRRNFLRGALAAPVGLALASSITVRADDPTQATAGELIAWGGPLPELPQIGGETNSVYQGPDLHLLDVLGINQVDSRFHSPFIKPSGPPVAPKPPTPQITGGHPPYP